MAVSRRPFLDVRELEAKPDVTHCHPQSPTITHSHPQSPTVTHCHLLLQEITAHLRELEAQPEGAPNTVFAEALGVPPSVLEQTIDLDRYANAAWLSR